MLFRSLQAFAQFASDLDAATQAQLARGVRLRELLKQNQYAPRTLHEQVTVVYGGINGLFDDVPVEKVAPLVAELCNYINTSKPELVKEVNEGKKLTDKVQDLIKESIAECKQSFMAA